MTITEQQTGVGFTVSACFSNPETPESGNELRQKTVMNALQSGELDGINDRSEPAAFANYRAYLNPHNGYVPIILRFYLNPNLNYAPLGLTIYCANFTKVFQIVSNNVNYFGNRLTRFGFRAIMETKKQERVSKGGCMNMELRERIISAATELFRKMGLKFTMQEVAAALNISKKTIYTVYPSKEALLMDMIDSLFADIHRTKAELTAEDAPIEERIRKVIVALPEQYAAMDFRLLDELEEKYPAAAKRVHEHLETDWEPTIALLEEGMSEGRIRRVSIPLLQQMIVASIERFLSDESSKGRYADMLEEMIDIIMNGIKRQEYEV